MRQRAAKRNVKDVIKPFALYATVFVLLITAVSSGYRSSQQSNDATVGNVFASQDQDTSVAVADLAVDKKIATDIAADFAFQTNMPIASNVSNLSISLSKEQEISQTEERVVAKPQIVQPTAQSRSIITYKAKVGETVQVVAQRFGVSGQTIKWANNLNTDALEDGRELTIPPVNGVVYTVKDGDTAESIAQKYKGSVERIISFNDLEVDGVRPGAKIVIPDGELPENERPGYVPPRSRYSRSNAGNTGGFDAGAVSGAYTARMRATAGNAYALGNCTWYAFERRKELGRPIGSFWGNGADWARSGAAAGATVNKTPAPGAIMQNGGGYGHVAIVETVNPDGSIVVSEMNYAGFNVVSNRTISAGQIGKYNFIH